MLARHCDRDGCDTWQRLDTDLPNHFWDVTQDDTTNHFCSKDCLLHWAADSEPVETIGGDH